MPLSARAAASTLTALALSVVPLSVAPAGATPASGCATPSVTRTTLPLPAGIASSTPIAISPNGKYVVANVITDAFGFHAMRWVDGVATRLDSATSDFGLVVSVNNAGAATGLEVDADGVFSTFVRTLTRYRRIHLAGWSITPYGINARGQVALVLQDARNVSWAGTWDDGTVTRLGRIQLTGQDGGPVIDAAGNLAYAAPSAGGHTHAVFVDAATRTVTPLARLAGVHDPIIAGIGPDRSVVATTTTFGRDSFRAVVWPSPSQPGALLPTTTGTGQTLTAFAPGAVNASGVVVGTEYVPADRRGSLETGRPVTWSGSTPTRLPVPDPTTSDRAVAVNDIGTVVGEEEVSGTGSRALAWRCGQLVRLTDGTETTSGPIALSQNDIVLGTYQSPSDAKPLTTLWTLR